MDVQCERCKTEYEFDDALVSGRGTTVRCTHCGHQFKIRRQEGGDGGGDRWEVQTAGGQEFTFLSLRELQRAIAARQISRHDVLRRPGSAPRALGSMRELDPFFEGRVSSTPPPATAVPAGHDPIVSVTFPAPSTAGWDDNRTAPAIEPARPVAAYPETSGEARRPNETLRPAFGAGPPAPQVPIQPQPILSSGSNSKETAAFGSPPAGYYAQNVNYPETRVVETPPFPVAALETSSPLPPPTRPVRYASGGEDYEQPETASSVPPSYGEQPYSMRQGRRVGGWIVALVLLMAVGVLGWAVARPYLRNVNGNASAAAQLDPRAEAFLSEGEKAMGEGKLEEAQESLDKASALAETDPRVQLDEARLANAQADIPWLKLKLLPTGAAAADEVRATKVQIDDRVGRALRYADAALATAPDSPAAFCAKIDALRLSGQQSAARGYVTKVMPQASQPETAYVLAALDLAEPEPVWATVIERLRLSVSREGSVGRARAALVYALAKSGDLDGAKSELVKLESLPRPYPLLPNLHAMVDAERPAKSAVESRPDAGIGSGARAAASTGPVPPPAPPPQGGGQASAGEGNPGDSRSAMQTASQAVKRGDYARAEQIYQALVTRNPNDSEAIAALGDVARARGNTPAAISNYKRAIAVNPSYLPALMGLADTQWMSGDRASAVRRYEDIADRFPEGTYPAYVKQRAESAAPANVQVPVGPAKPAPSSAPANESSE